MSKEQIVKELKMMCDLYDLHIKAHTNNNYVTIYKKPSENVGELSRLVFGITSTAIVTPTSVFTLEEAIRLIIEFKTK